MGKTSQFVKRTANALDSSTSTTSSPNANDHKRVKGDGGTDEESSEEEKSMDQNGCEKETEEDS